MTQVPSSPLGIDCPVPHIKRLTLARPERLNALSRALVDELADAVAQASRDGTRVLILAAAGRGFCVGADLKERATMSAEERYAHNRAINAVAQKLNAAPMPVIALINGAAFGGGLELALAADIRLMADTAEVALSEARIGALPGAGGTQRLPRLIGPGRALEMMFGGEPVGAVQALEWGLVNRVVSPEQLTEAGLQLARSFASRSPRTAARLKRAVWAGLDTTLEQGLELERAAVVEVFSSADYAKGLKAFADKRQPRFD